MLQAIHDSCTKRGVPPTVRELASSVGLTRSTIHWRIDRLVEKGLITRMTGLPRSLALTSRGRQDIAEQEFAK